MGPFSLRVSLRFSLPHVRSRPRLDHRGRVAGRESFVERLVEVRILIGHLRLGLGFLVHGNFSGSPFRNQPGIAVGGSIIPPILSCENAHFTISNVGPCGRACDPHMRTAPFRAGPRDYSASRGCFEQALSIGMASKGSVREKAYSGTKPDRAGCNGQLDLEARFKDPPGLQACRSLQANLFR